MAKTGDLGQQPDTGNTGTVTVPAEKPVANLLLGGDHSAANAKKIERLTEGLSETDANKVHKVMDGLPESVKTDIFEGRGMRSLDQFGRILAAGAAEMKDIGEYIKANNIDTAEFQKVASKDGDVLKGFLDAHPDLKAKVERDGKAAYDNAQAAGKADDKAADHAISKLPRGALINLGAIREDSEVNIKRAFEGIPQQQQGVEQSGNPASQRDLPNGPRTEPITKVVSRGG